jgi:ferritin
MMTPKMKKALNNQLNAELFASYLYLSMCAWFESQGLTGFASWMRVQVQEEMFHAIKIFDYIHERKEMVTLEEVAKPESTWDSPMAAIESAVKHEQKVTGMINDLVNCAIDERDHAANQFLQWYIAEQVEEEANFGAVHDKLRLVGNDSAGLFTLDLEMSKRVFVPPAAA